MATWSNSVAPAECMLIGAAGCERGRARRTMYVALYTWYAITILLVA